MNNQEAFTKVKEHLLTQMQRSYNEQGECAYRGEDGLMCAIGCLIPDNLYKKSWEGKNYLVPLTDLAGKGIFEAIDTVLLGRLQSMHDVIEPKNWEYLLKHIAKDWNLKY